MLGRVAEKLLRAENVPIDHRDERVFRIARIEDDKGGHSGRTEPDLVSQGNGALGAPPRADEPRLDLGRVFRLLLGIGVIGLFLAEKLGKFGRGHVIDIGHGITFPALSPVYPESSLGWNLRSIP